MMKHGDVNQETTVNSTITVADCQGFPWLALVMLAPYQISHPEIHGLEEVSPIGNLHIKHKPDLPRIPERNQNLFGVNPWFQFHSYSKGTTRDSTNPSSIFCGKISWKPRDFPRIFQDDPGWYRCFPATSVGSHFLARSDTPGTLPITGQPGIGRSFCGVVAFLLGKFSRFNF